MEQQNDEEVARLALDAGHILLENGAEIFRVEETIDRICRHYGVESCNAFVLSNGIFLTAACREAFWNDRNQDDQIQSGRKQGDQNPKNSNQSGRIPTGRIPTDRIFAEVRHIPVGSTHLYKITAVNQLSREIAEGAYTLTEAREKLEQIRSMPGKRAKMQILASAVGSAAFCMMFGGNIRDAATAFAAGFLLYAFLLLFADRHLSKIVGTITGSILITLLCGISCRAGIGAHMNYMIMGSIMPMVPGVAFTTAIRDVANSDYLSGAVRMLDAMLIFFCIAFGVGVGIAMLHACMGGTFL